VQDHGMITLKDFTTIEKLGAGVSGSVEKVVHAKTGEVYALKKINFISNDDQEKLLTRELDALISCDSSYIVQCYGAFYSQGQICIWLEYMDMGSLQTLMNLQENRRLPEPILMMITYKVQFSHIL
jgi:serine/threonine protein kinase